MDHIFTKKARNIVFFVGVIVTAAALKLWLIVGEHIPFNADEAIVALMARHINQGEIPIFFYGQSYMGSFDAMLIAMGFQVFGEGVWVIRIVQSLLYIGIVLTTVEVGKRAFHSQKVGLLAALFLAVPTVNVTLYTTASLGGYGEGLLLGNVMLILGFQIADAIDKGGDLHSPTLKRNWALWGFLFGFGLWVNGLTLVFSLPMGIYLSWLLIENRKSLSIFAAVGFTFGGAVLGSSPWWFYAVKNGWHGLVLELSGSAIANVNQIPAGLKPFIHFYNLLLFGSTVTFGLRPPWSVQWLMLPLIPFTLMFWIGVCVYIIQRIQPERKNHTRAAVVAGVIGVTLAGFIFSPFGADPSGRYFVPLAVPFALFAADLIFRLQEERAWLGAVCVLLVLCFNLGGIIQSVHRLPQGLTTQFDEVTRIDHAYDEALIRFLKRQDIKRGYTNYWVAYPLAFLSQEELIFVPQLPYHQDFRYTSRDNRYPPYQKMVDSADQIAYITTHHPALDEYLEREFQKAGLEWQYTEIGDYHIFYDLSSPLRPGDIGLGETTGEKG